jgi:hypothetical protein
MRGDRLKTRFDPLILPGAYREDAGKAPEALIRGKEKHQV